MKNIKKGNAIIGVLIMSMVLCIIGATITSAVLNTTKSNARSKDREDLFYAVESGIELGIALVKSDISYINSSGNVALQGDINEKSNEMITKDSNAVHSVDITIKEESGKSRVKIKSVAYGYDNDGNKNINNKRVIEKTISRKANKTLLSEDILQNSIVAEDKISINAATIYMERTQITAGGGTPVLNKLGDMKEPIIKNDNYNSPIFKGDGKTRSMPNIRKQAIVEVEQVAKFATTKSLFEQANVLADDGSTIAENGIGKIYSLEDGMGNWGNYNVILVNADKLIIEPSIYAFDENRTIVICSGDIEIRLAGKGGYLTQAANITQSTFFGKNVIMTDGAALTIDGAPRIGQESEQISKKQLDKINDVVSKYIENWGTNDALDDTAIGDDWEVIDSESVYE